VIGYSLIRGAGRDIAPIFPVVAVHSQNKYIVPGNSKSTGATQTREVEMRDFAIHLSHKPGEMARVAHALARAGVNLKTVAGMVIGNQGLLRLIPDDIDAARRALQEDNIRFEESEPVTVLLENRAGELEDVAAKLGNAGVNLQALYVVGLDGDLVELAIVADDAKKAKKVLE
jgi:hypothetical protein